MSTVGKAVDGLGSLGKFQATFGLITAIVIGVCLISSGGYLIFDNNDDQYATVEGTVVTSDCTRYISSRDKYGNPKYSYKCVVTVSYTYMDKQYTNQLDTSSSSKYLKNEKISLSVDKKDPTNIKVASMSSATMGSILSCVALFMFGCAYLNYYMTQHYKYYAAAQGTGLVADVVFRR